MKVPVRINHIPRHIPEQQLVTSPRFFDFCQWHCTNGYCVHRVFLLYVILYNINSIVSSVSLLTQAFRPTGRDLVGLFEGALGLGCRSRAPLGLPWTESSALCYVAAAPELFIELSRTEHSFKIQRQGPERVQGFCGCRSQARQ